MAVEISTIEELQAITLDLEADYVQVNDIDATETVDWNETEVYGGFVPIGIDHETGTGDFTGTYDGRGYKISNLYIETDDSLTHLSSYVSLFMYIDNTEVKNIILENFEYIGADTSGSRVGGICGRTSNSNFLDCHVSGNITDTISRVGGLIGSADKCVIKKCSSDIDIETKVGVVGTVPVQSIGGFIGKASNVHEISDCYCTGRVDTSGSEHEETQRYIGGFIGNIQSPDVEENFLNNIYTSVEVIYDETNIMKGTEEYDLVGSLIGFMGTYDEAILYLTGVYANEDINPNMRFIGDTSHLVTYTVDGVTVMENSGLRTTEQMTDYENNYPQTYIGWDFDNIWTVDPLVTDINDNTGYPSLRAWNFISTAGRQKRFMIYSDKILLSHNLIQMRQEKIRRELQTDDGILSFSEGDVTSPEVSLNVKQRNLSGTISIEEENDFGKRIIRLQNKSLLILDIMHGVSRGKKLTHNIVDHIAIQPKDSNEYILDISEDGLVYTTEWINGDFEIYIFLKEKATELVEVDYNIICLEVEEDIHE